MKVSHFRKLNPAATSLMDCDMRKMKVSHGAVIVIVTLGYAAR